MIELSCVTQNVMSNIFSFYLLVCNTCTIFQKVLQTRGFVLTCNGIICNLHGLKKNMGQQNHPTAYHYTIIYLWIRNHNHYFQYLLGLKFGWGFPNVTLSKHVYFKTIEHFLGCPYPMISCWTSQAKLCRCEMHPQWSKNTWEGRMSSKPWKEKLLMQNFAHFQNKRLGKVEAWINKRMLSMRHILPLFCLEPLKQIQKQM